eukprot:158836-Prymnesium_polylepis.4
MRSAPQQQHVPYGYAVPSTHNSNVECAWPVPCALWWLPCEGRHLSALRGPPCRVPLARDTRR